MKSRQSGFNHFMTNQYSLKNVYWILDAFENNFEMKRKSKKKLKDSCKLCYDLKNSLFFYFI